MSENVKSETVNYGNNPDMIITRRALLCEIWDLLERNTAKLKNIPEKEQRFDWQDMANLRGCFREGPNNSGRTIDSFDTKRLKSILFRLEDIEDCLNRHIRKQVEQWEQSVKANPPQRVF